MKLLGVFILISLLTINCNKNSKADSKITGKWRLIEQLLDPGDGSGEYVTIDSEKTLDIKSDGTFTCNGDICSINGKSEYASSGIFDSEAKTITGTACMTESLFDIGYSFKSGKLILAFPCFEPCLQKFERIE